MTDISTNTNENLTKCKERIDEVNQQYKDGFITTKEYLNKMVDVANTYFDLIDYDG